MPQDDRGGDILIGKYRFERISVPVQIIAIVLIAAGLAGWFWFTKVQPPELQTLRETIEQQREEMTEYNQHIAEMPEVQLSLLDDDHKGKMTVSRYDDNCVTLSRRGPNGSKTILIVDPTRDKHRAPKLIHRSMVSPIVPRLAAGGRCLGFHPGPFQSWNGQQQGCWIPVFRRWADGCQHVQMYDACHRTWDEVKWQTCVH